MENNLYYKYSDYLKCKYNEKVYKIPINLPLSCPNRINGAGCTYCGENAVGYESLENTMSVSCQLSKNIAYIGPRYGSGKFIAYFQNYTNTFLSPSLFKKYMNECARDDVVEISVSTRPDCVDERYLDILKEVSLKTGMDICVELGLQSVNHRTLQLINRGHGLAEFIDAVLMIKKYGFTISAHMILNLPYDDLSDVIEGAKILSALKVDFVKMHSLYICKNTKMESEYLSGNLDLKDVDDYVKKASEFLAYLDKDIAVQRLVSRAPKQDTVFCNYGISWWKIRDFIHEYMTENNLYQGCKCDYLGGKNVKNFK